MYPLCRGGSAIQAGDSLHLPIRKEQTGCLHVGLGQERRKPQTSTEDSFPGLLK